MSELENIIKAIDEADEVEIMEFDFKPCFKLMRELEQERDQLKDDLKTEYNDLEDSLVKKEDEIDQLKQQLAEQAAYSQHLKSKIPLGVTFDVSPSSALLAEHDAKVIKDYAYNLPFKGDVLTRKEAERHLGKYIATGGNQCDQALRDKEGDT
jgi:hypothetical protein